ncbi:hypothetical protein SmJEL517_g00195 [Synchytrium microbalum]|uniref:Dolichol phosphate-mannose biosynthesis regulatory protein n=1 Tax=Synchytrium microbalum TaxID=1806994 RepID=A0A507CKD8_9FUNG|nr:uncharacterized protein SmJEL517_g00195 [Synchytrium microbalum]TPX38375.1 hypothetical protein SmJEL517_g00195 [Synchytrium microbalum]
MASVSDQLVGGLLLFVALFVFIYYTTWALIMPFVNPSHPTQSLFLPREWAIRIPVAILLVALTLIFTFIHIVTTRAVMKKKAK